MTRTQKRNLKKNIREKEKKALGKTGARVCKRITNAFVPVLFGLHQCVSQGTAQGLYPEDPFQDERIAVLEHVEQVLASLPTLAQMKSLDVLAFHGQQQTTLDNLLSRLINAREELCTKVLSLLLFIVVKLDSRGYFVRKKGVCSYRAGLFW